MRLSLLVQIKHNNGEQNEKRTNFINSFIYRNTGRCG